MSKLVPLPGQVEYPELGKSLLSCGNRNYWIIYCLLSSAPVLAVVDNYVSKLDSNWLSDCNKEIDGINYLFRVESAEDTIINIQNWRKNIFPKFIPQHVIEDCLGWESLFSSRRWQTFLKAATRISSCSCADANFFSVINKVDGWKLVFSTEGL